MHESILCMSLSCALVYLVHESILSTSLTYSQVPPRYITRTCARVGTHIHTHPHTPTHTCTHTLRLFVCTSGSHKSTMHKSIQLKIPTPSSNTQTKNILVCILAHAYACIHTHEHAHTLPGCIGVVKFLKSTSTT